MAYPFRKLRMFSINRKLLDLLKMEWQIYNVVVINILLRWSGRNTTDNENPEDKDT